MNWLFRCRGPCLLQQFSVAHHHHERGCGVGSWRSLEVEGVVWLRHAGGWYWSGHGQRNVRALLFDVIFAACNVQFGRTCDLNHLAFHLERLAMYDVPDRILI